MSTSSRSKLPIVGVIVALVGVAAAAVLWFLASSQVADAAKSLAPAPVDCDTALDFEDAGTYLIYAETTGEVGELDGDCANDDQSYEGSDTNLDITMFDSDENEVGLRRDSDGPTYDAGGRKGVLLYRVEIEEPGEFTLRVQGDDAEVVARVGKNPNDGAGVLRMGAIGALIAGLLLGALLILLGRRAAVGARPRPAGSLAPALRRSAPVSAGSVRPARSTRSARWRLADTTARTARAGGTTRWRLGRSSAGTPGAATAAVEPAVSLSGRTGSGVRADASP
ncbi:MAG: hypothetical protein WKF45_03545 [Ilumatobacteraceae bacterium]